MSWQLVASYPTETIRICFLYCLLAEEATLVFSLHFSVGVTSQKKKKNLPFFPLRADPISKTFFIQKSKLEFKKVDLLAGDQWWPRTNDGRLRSVRAITYLLRLRVGNFVKGNKRNLHKKDWLNSVSARQEVDSFPKPPTCQHRGISRGLQSIRHK